MVKKLQNPYTIGILKNLLQQNLTKHYVIDSRASPTLHEELITWRNFLK